MNWWGPLTHPEKERWLNSKLTSFELSLREGWSSGAILPRETVLALEPEKKLLIKDPFNMSGKGMVILEPKKMVMLPQSMQGKLIVEPLLNRKKDFSHFIFPDGSVICYENLVDEKFQYRGTIFSDTKNFKADSLSFYSELSPEKWNNFYLQLEKIKSHYGNDAEYGYSVDSFVYEDDHGELQIFPLCEVNARRTMGLIAYELTKVLAPGTKSALTLKVPLLKNAIKLSPENVRFEIYLSFE
jgi:hypothetical protein